MQYKITYSDASAGPHHLMNESTARRTRLSTVAGARDRVSAGRTRATRHSRAAAVVKCAQRARRATPAHRTLHRSCRSLDHKVRQHVNYEPPVCIL